MLISNNDKLLALPPVATTVNVYHNGEGKKGVKLRETTKKWTDVKSKKQKTMKT